MEASQAKLIALVSLGISSMLVGLLPACFAQQSRRQWPLLLSCLLCFGGGVLLCTSLVHILSEARKEIQQEYKQYTELFFCAGFFLLYLMDEIVHFFYGEVAGHSHSHYGDDETHLSTSEGTNNHFAERSFDPNFTRRHSTIPKPNYGACSSQAEKNNLLYRQLPYNPNFFKAKSDSALFCDEPPSQLCHVMHQEPCQATIPTTNIGLLVALSIHSLLEGLAVGLESLTSKVLLLLGAIASHKLVVGFCLGVELASNQYVKFCKHFLCILVFAGSSVVGIFIGILISDIPTDVLGIVVPILQALAGGTLLYVSVSEVLPRERARWHQQHSKRVAGVAQFISVGLGYVMMALLGKYLDH
ncbi:zinc transporter ZIP1 [Euwallacea similis]|uniref:zinc transporter ZIP1 n=1 Tax=Euwallacea similis TaxID=1736056 RepID=UPI00344D2894